MPDARGMEHERSVAAWLVLNQLRAAALILGWLMRASRMSEAGRIVERACSSALLASFPLFQRRLSMMQQMALCARAADVVAAPRRGLIQSMMFLWLTRTRSYAAQILDLESLDAMRFVPDVPAAVAQETSAAAQETSASQVMTMAGKQ